MGFSGLPARADGNGDPPFGGLIKTPYNYQPPPHHHDEITENVWKLKPVGAPPKAHGKVRLVCYSDDHDAFRLYVWDLDPHKVYTVWFTKSLKPDPRRTGVGPAPYSFKTAGSGNKVYPAPLTFCPLVHWRWVEVREQPDGDPTHFANSILVFKARLLSR